MKTSQTIPQILRSLDSQKGQELSSVDTRTKEELLQQIIAEKTEASHSSQRAIVAKKRRVLIGAVTALVAGGVASTLIFSSLNAPQPPSTNFALSAGGALYGWTEVPSSVSGPTEDAAFDFCREESAAFFGKVSAGSEKILSSERRGELTAIFFESQGNRAYCMVGDTEVVGFYPLDDPAYQAPLPDASSISLDTQGGTVTVDKKSGTPPTMLTVFTGHAGANIRSVTVRLPGGKNVVATVQNGLWSAWWPEEIVYTAQATVSPDSSSPSPDGDTEFLDLLPGSGPQLEFVTVDGKKGNYIPRLLNPTP